MATPRRRSDPLVERALFEEPYRFDFFQAVRILERLARERRPVGRAEHPRREVVRFQAARGLAFPPSAVQQLEPAADAEDGPARMTVAFMGLTGPMGVLPYCYTELIVERRRAGDRTLAAFLDLLNHRLISLFYRAWEKYRPAICFERGDQDHFDGAISSLIGLGIEPLRNRHDFPDAALFAHAGALAQRHRSAIMLEQLLRDCFGIPVEVQQFQGRWLRLEPDDQSTMGASGRHHQLGVSLVIGSKVWDEQGKFRLRLGPLSFEQFQAFAPDGPHFRSLVQLTRFYVNAELDFDVQLVLKAEDVPDSQFRAEPTAGICLGRRAWLKVGTLPRDADDAIFAADN